MLRKNTGWLTIMVAIIFLGAACTPTIPIVPAGPNPSPSGLAYLEMPNVTYGENIGAEHKMDIYLPAGRTSSFTKVIVLIHGGGWNSGSKEEMNILVAQFRQKWPDAALVNINYRLATATSNQHPAQMADIRAVLDWLDANGAGLNISRKYALVGVSAGAHLSLLYGYAFDPEKRVKAIGDIFGPTDLQNFGWTQGTYAIVSQNAIVPFMGVPLNANSLQKYKDASPYWRATAQSQPTIIFHGEGDIVVPISQSDLLFNQLGTLGVDREYRRYPGLPGHALADGNLLTLPLGEVGTYLTNFLKQKVQ